jgi:predicted GNAT family acetyltransferase
VVSPSDNREPQTSAPAATDWDAAAISEATHLNLVEFARSPARWSSAGALLEEHGAVLAAGGRPYPVVFNNALREVRAAIGGEELLERAAAFFGPRGHSFGVWVRSDVDDDLRPACTDRGLQRVVAFPQMVCDAPVSMPADGPQPVRVADDVGVQDFWDVCASAYESIGLPRDAIDSLDRFSMLLVPSVVAYVLYLSGEPVSAALAMVSHGVGGIYWVGTVPAARRHGYGDLCSRAATNAGFALGAKTMCLQASPMGAPIYERLGYRTIYTYDIYAGG